MFVGRHQEVGLDAMMPSRLIEGLCNLPSSEQSEDSSHASSSSEPPTKRRKKASGPALPSIPVLKTEVSISRECADVAPTDFTTVRRDVGQHVRFLIVSNILQITLRTGPKYSPHVTLRPQDADKAARSLLSKVNLAQAKSRQGALWYTVDVTVQRSGRKVTILITHHFHWNETPSLLHQLRPTADRRQSQLLIDALLPDSAQIDRSWSPMDFYDAAFVPPKDDQTPSTIEVPVLEATLFPYQKRTLQWLLKREGVQWSETDKTIVPYAADQEEPVNAFRKLVDVAGNDYYLNELLHVVTRDPAPFRNAEKFVKGGILAEEMGLGKTLEILGLVLLHQRATPLVATDYEVQANLTPTGATLIVTPESLRAQWISEIGRHAPGLSVKFYQGRKKMSDDEDQIINELAGHDIIITTYAILSAELHFVAAAPERSRRHERVYPRAKSPLAQLAWWRVCLDEAQMIESGVSQAATVARVLPRVNAWGITGTPVKDDVKDLFGLLLFLQYEPYCTSTHVWRAMIERHKPIFQRLFNSIAIRHTKPMVRDELVLPPQKRFVISMPFTAVEEQHYQSLFREMAEECDLDLRGAPLLDDWKPEDHEESMRTWLNRLRQTALHPEVAGYNRRLGHSKSRPMRTVDEVLDAMIEQSEVAIRADEKAYLSSKLTRGQLYENSPRVREALEIWTSVREETRKLVSDARAEFQALTASNTDGNLEADADGDQDEDSEDEMEAGNKGQLGESRRRLRGALEMEHRAVFFCANAYFQIRDNPEMTEPDSEEFLRLRKLEDDGYNEAKAIRREILRESHGKATRLMKKIAQKASEQSFAELPELVAGTERGIESGRIIDDLEALYGELNDQANVIDEFREYLIGLLLKPLVDEEDEVDTTGEEMGESARVQEEVVVYVQALRAIVADRQDALTGQSNELIKHEAETSLKFAREGEGPAPQKLIELMTLRDQSKPQSTSMRKAISEFRALSSRLAKDTNRSVLEAQIADRQLKATQALLNKQSKATTALEAEVENFRNIMNLRVEYYRQLQVVSDSVLPYDGPNTEATMVRMKETEDNLRKKLSSNEAKHRYLLNLKESGNKSNEPRICVICQTPFTVGVLTVCGHQFCKECMMLWFKAHHNCPVCKKKLKSSNLHDITINPQQLKVLNDNPEQEQDQEQNEVGDIPQKRNSLSNKTAIYSEFNADKLAEIQNIELDGVSFTTKVDTLIKHILWLRESDPGAKSIIFSQYKGFLNILRNAFSRSKIGFASIDDASGITRFKEDPSAECFLLHARAHSSGLNLVNASHVFLCEPLLNTALELQAIARVDRIGQQHETTVWLYLVTGTVEESIYNLSVQRRMEHMRRTGKGKSKESAPDLLAASIDEANTLELEQAALSRLMSKDKTAGENVEKNDLWECLFGHVARQDEAPEKDTRLQEQAVMGYLAAEAADERMGQSNGV